MLRQHVGIRAVIVNDIVLNSDVRDVYGLVDVSGILGRRIDVAAQDWLADVAHVDEVIGSRTNIELDVHARAYRAAFINNAGPARWQRRPAAAITAKPP